MLEKKKIRDITFDLACKEGWHWVTMGKIAEVSGESEESLTKSFISKEKILSNFFEEMDQIMLQSSCIEANDDYRDQLFELLMGRFDALQPYKTRLESILRDQLWLPCHLFYSLTQASQSMALVLKTVGISTSGFSGKLKITSLLLIYSNSFRIWLTDKTNDNSKTMVAMDNGLRRIHVILEPFRN